MRYERLRRLGGGETAETYLCRDRWRGGRLVAQKVFSLEWSRHSPDLIDHEFRILSGISHPHVASIEDFGQEGESLYLVSEFVDGKTILDHLRDADVYEIVAVFFQVLEALDHLYFRNIVHLDLKPENILVRPAAGSQAATVKLIDFGLATLAFGLEASPSGALGSPPFTAPELAIGRTVDARSDLYSVGALLYTALSGRPPYDGDELIEILNQQLKKDPQPLCEVAPRVSPNLSSFVQRLMAREIGNRFENPRSALHAFGEALGESFPVAQAAPIPLFEDPDLIFREREFEDLYQRIRDRGGRWAIRAGDGMGKTFLARWLERAFWKERRTVVAWSGERLVLAEDERSAQKPQSVVIIDDADQGPVAEWVAARGYKTVVALGEKLEGLAGPSWTEVTLKPLTRADMEGIFKNLFGADGGNLAKAWMKESGGNLRDFVRLGRALLRKGVLHKEGGGWRWNADATAYDPSDPDALSLGGAKKHLLKILTASRISLEADMLALWTDQSVAEVEELLAELLKDGVLEKFVEAGRVNYRAADAGVRLPEDDALAADPERLARVLEKLYDEGRYRDGLDLWSGKGGTPGLLRLRAKLLANAGFHEEAIAILSDGFLSGDDLETRGKAFLFAGRTDEAARDLEAARAAAEKAGDTDGLARALLHQGILRQRAGVRDEAKKIYERVLELAPKTERPALIEGTAALNLANLYYNLSDWNRAEEFYQRSLERLKETGHGAVTAQANLNYAALAFYQGKLLKAAHLCREALRLAVDHRYDLTQGRSLLLLAMIHEKEGRPLRQDERLAEAVSIFGKAGLSFELSQALIHRSYFYESGGRLKAAESDARQALSQAEAIGAADLAAQARLILGKTLGVRGGKEEALSCVEAALRHFTAHQNLPMQQECDAVLRSLGEDSHE